MKPHSREAELFRQVLPLFNAMGDPTRQLLIKHLSNSTRLSVGELTRLTSLSRPAVSHHLKVLREAELVLEIKVGTKRYYRPTFLKYTGPMRELINCVEKYENGIMKREWQGGAESDN